MLLAFFWVNLLFSAFFFGEVAFDTLSLLKSPKCTSSFASAAIELLMTDWIGKFCRWEAAYSNPLGPAAIQ